jgi:hypothetical protein
VRRLASIAIAIAALAGCGKDAEKQVSVPHASSTPSGSTQRPATTAAPATTAQPASTATGSSSTPSSGSSGAGGSQPADELRRGVPVGVVPRAGGPVADQRAVVRTVRTYLVAISHADGVQACAQLTPEGRRFLERNLAKIAPETKGTPCEGSITLYQGAYGAAIKNPRVTGVRVNGDRARAIGPLHQAVALVKQDRLWRISRYEQ